MRRQFAFLCTRVRIRLFCIFHYVSAVWKENTRNVTDWFNESGHGFECVALFLFSRHAYTSCLFCHLRIEWKVEKNCIKQYQYRFHFQFHSNWKPESKGYQTTILFSVVAVMSPHHILSVLSAPAHCTSFGSEQNNQAKAARQSILT